jgi:hypothetical protein
MKTRTLLLLALACGVAIMLAGAVFLVQLLGQDDVEPAVAIGEQVVVGDMRVTVQAVTESAGALDVTLRVGGVDDDDPTREFRLIASGRAVEPDLAGEHEGVCGSFTVTDQTCRLRFDVSGADGTSRVLFYERGDQRARWVLS